MVDCTGNGTAYYLKSKVPLLKGCKYTELVAFIGEDIHVEGTHEEFLGENPE